MSSLNAAAGWLGLVVLLLGIAAGITVPLVFPVSHWLTAVMVMGVLVLVVLEGSYCVWDATDEQRKVAQTTLDGEGKGHCGTLPSLRDFVASGSRLRLRSTAPILAEGGGLVDQATLDADHHPGNPSAVGRAVESNHGEEDPPQPAGAPGEDHG